MLIGLDLIGWRSKTTSPYLILTSFFFQHAIHQLTIQALFKLQVFYHWRDHLIIKPFEHWNNRPVHQYGQSDHGLSKHCILTLFCCRPSSRNGKYTNGIGGGGGGGYPGIQNMAYSPAYSNGVSFLQHTTSFIVTSSIIHINQHTQMGWVICSILYMFGS